MKTRSEAAHTAARRASSVVHAAARQASSVKMVNPGLRPFVKGCRAGSLGLTLPFPLFLNEACFMRPAGGSGFPREELPLQSTISINRKQFKRYENSGYCRHQPSRGVNPDPSENPPSRRINPAPQNPDVRRLMNRRDFITVIPRRTKCDEHNRSSIAHTRQRGEKGRYFSFILYCRFANKRGFRPTQPTTSSRSVPIPIRSFL